MVSLFHRPSCRISDANTSCFSRQLPHCDVIIYSFHYLLDPKIADQVSKEMSKDSIVVFDEAHNIDNVCIESLSIDLTRPMLDSAARSCVKLENKIEEIKRTDATKLQDEYSKLVAGLQDANEGREEDDMLANPVLSEDMVQEAVPGNIRKAEHFVAFLKRFVEYMKVSRLSLYERRVQLTITVDPDASSACRRRNTTVFPTTSKGHHLHREEAAQVRVLALHQQRISAHSIVQVLRGTPYLAGAHAGTNPDRRISCVAKASAICHSGRHIREG